MIGFQPYETFQLLIETGGVDRTNTLLCAACDAFARRGRPTGAEMEQFAALAQRLFPAAAPAARAKAAATLGRSEDLSPELEQLVVRHLGDDLPDFLVSAPRLSESTMLKVISSNDVTLGAALARRADLSNGVLGRLFQMNSRKVYRAIATNTAIVPRGPYLSALARSAQMDHQVAWSLAAREDFDAALLAPAFFDLGETDRVKVINAFSQRQTPAAPIKRTLEQLSVATGELTRALMKLFSENRRPEVTKLLHQITGLDEVRCGQIAHDTSGAALFVVLRAFGCDAQDGLKVLIHATSHDEDRSKALAQFSKLFETVSVDATAFLMSAWRGEVNLLDMTKPEYKPFEIERRRIPPPQTRERNPVVDQAIEALARIGARAS
ncbi:hypothetical protein ASC89_09185 [Devosia sp. Root413D1]|uniref:DUF2336 domain-containing protein n=1 Tax=unclassified Devosia TaxID=196773 RepID=UPI0006F2B492|nr:MULTISPECIES: DUF2336 domain-containing protein [unclassified Devosia]KQU94151.1 hypothetical protein ASC68_21040 [Devosia sp. Root105]KQW80257.1 hypothetical protein ASC89_09185 [Devosia sp. Root413D1]